MHNGNHNASKPVRKLDAEGRILAEYLSVRQAAQENGLSYRYLLARIQAGKPCHGVHFVYHKIEQPKMEDGKKENDGFQMTHNPYYIYAGRKK